MVFGKKDGFTASMDLGALTGSDGFVLEGIDAADNSGYSVSSAGDVNGDGYADILIGSYGGDPGGSSKAGETYLVYGRDFTGDSTVMDALSDDRLVALQLAGNRRSDTEASATFDVCLGRVDQTDRASEKQYPERGDGSDLVVSGTDSRAQKEDDDEN